MRKWILIIFVHLILFQYTLAQDQVGCNQLLEDAKEAYAAGMVELVPELLIPCIESGLNGTPKQEAYKLVITSYLFDYLPEQADSLMNDFLNEFPDYQTGVADPSEFTILLASHQQRRNELLEATNDQEIVEDISAPEKEKQRVPKEKTQRTRRTGTQAASTTGVGFILGTNLSFPQLIELYSTSDPLLTTGDYSQASPGFHVGAAVNLKLSRSVETAFELLYQRPRFKYSAEPYSFTSYEYEEVQNRFELPVSFIFNLNPENKTKVYLRFGIMADYLLSAGASAVRTYSGAGNNFPDVVLEDTDITTSRARMNLYGLGGAGIKIPLQNAYIFMESRFQYGVFKGNKQSERYYNQDLIWLIYHIDNDFRLNQLNISAGMIFYIK